MKNKTLFCVLLFVVLFAFFAFCCSAADIQDSYDLTNIPIGRNIAQVPSGNTTAASVLWDFYVPSSAYTSAYYEVYNYTTPKNDRVKCGRCYDPLRGDLEVGDNYLSYYDGIFGSGSHTANQIVAGGYVHFYIDCGGNVAPYTTSRWVMQNLKVRRTDRDTSDYTDFPFTVYQYGNAVWCTVPMAESPLGLFSIVLTVPSLYADQLSTANICFNYMWVWIDNDEVSTLDRTIEPCGYSNAYYASNGFLNYEFISENIDQEVLNEYSDMWFDQGFRAGVETIGGAEFRRGYAAALDAYGENNMSLYSLITAIPDSLVGMLRSLFDFEFLGYNLFSLFKFIFALLAIALAVRLILRLVL